MIIDTHCHLDFDRFDADRDEVVARAVEADVARIIVPAVDLDSCAAVLELVDLYESVYAALGVHPNSSSGWQDGWVKRLRELAEHPKVVAIGEIGLDYYRDRAPKAVQRRAMAAQLDLAVDLSLPVIVHNRDSSQDVVELLTAAAAAGGLSGVLHSFSAGWDTARAALDLGFYLGFTGPVTYKNAESLRQIVARTPEDRLLVETDAPFLAPQRYRGQRNEPAYVTNVVERIAQVRGVEMTIVAQQTTTNAQRLFGDLGQ